MSEPMIRAIRKLDLHDGDIIVIESKLKLSASQSASISDGVKELGAARGIKVNAIVLDRGMNLRTVLRERKA